MVDEIVISQEFDENCKACSGGWGHQVDMTDGDLCKFRCRSCREEIVVDAKDDDWCCDHRYVGEDLWRAEQYYNQWGCPVCGEEYGEHDTSCEFFPCPSCGAVGDCAINCESLEESDDEEVSSD
jgi:hypothetical protein